MKIISKYKDYYDYLQGIYGVDEKLILDRTEFTPLKYIPSFTQVVTFYIGEWQIDGLWKDGKIYFCDEIEQFSNQKQFNPFKQFNIEEYWIIPRGKWCEQLYCLKKPKYLGDKSITWAENYPILYKTNTSLCKSPILNEFGFHKVFNPHEIWVILSEWLGKQITKNEPVVPVGDDKVRILSAGFDLKTSFRH